nr:hypothetical protein [Tanacetum cinerariifolium]
MSMDSVNRYNQLCISKSIKCCDPFMYGILCQEVSAIITDERFDDFHKKLQKMLYADELALILRLNEIDPDARSIAHAELMHSAVRSKLQCRKLMKASCALRTANISFTRSSKASDSDDTPADRAKKEWGLSPKAKVRVLHTAQLDVTVLSDNELWKQVMYKIWFKRNKNLALFEQFFQQLFLDNGSSWRLTFRAANESGDRNGLIKTARAYCKDCEQIFWVCDLCDSGKRPSSCVHHRVKSMTTQQVVDYILQRVEVLSESSEEENGGAPNQ